MSANAYTDDAEVGETEPCSGDVMESDLEQVDVMVVWNHTLHKKVSLK